MNNQAIQIKDLKFSYQKDSPLILNIEDLTIQKGEKLFLYGPSGYGKSTLLNILAGVLAVKSGRVDLLGKNLSELSQSRRDHLRGENIGYIFQNFNLISYLTIKENIILPCLINKKRSKGINFYNQADEIINTLELKDHTDKLVSELSIGQQQRVAAARALIGNPQVIIADEPTSALDEKNTSEFMELLFSEWEKKKFTLIFVSHDKELMKYFPRNLSLMELNKI